MKNELRQEREQILQQMGKQRVELEREIEKAKTEENYVRDRLALSLKVAFLLALQPGSVLGTHTMLLCSKSLSLHRAKRKDPHCPGQDMVVALLAFGTARGLGSGRSSLILFYAPLPYPQHHRLY